MLGHAKVKLENIKKKQKQLLPNAYHLLEIQNLSTLTMSIEQAHSWNPFSKHLLAYSRSKIRIGTSHQLEIGNRSSRE